MANFPYTFLGLTNEVLSFTGDGELNSTNFLTARGMQRTARHAVRDAVDDINIYTWEWPFNHADGEEYVYSGEDTYDLPSTYANVDWESFYITDPSDTDDPGSWLSPTGYDEWMRCLRGGATGKPSVIVRSQNDKFIVFPKPTQTYKITFDYWIKPTSLDAYDDVPTIPERFRNVIMLGARGYMFASKNDEENKRSYEKRFEDALKSMRGQLINPHQVAVQSTMLVGRGIGSGRYRI